MDTEGDYVDRWLFCQATISIGFARCSILGVRAFRQGSELCWDLRRPRGMSLGELMVSLLGAIFSDIEWKREQLAGDLEQTTLQMCERALRNHMKLVSVVHEVK